MPRTVPGSGASIEPIFNSTYGVKDVFVVNGGSGYDASDPPKLTIGNCGTPVRDAVLRPVINTAGEIQAVEVLDPGEGYSPLRLIIESTDDGAFGATGDVFLNATGGIDYIQVRSNGDAYFGGTTARIEGGGGAGSELVPITGSVTGLSLENVGRNYTRQDVALVIGGGGGEGATGVAEVNEFGQIENINISNPGEFFETPPIVQLIGGGGSGAAADAVINLGRIDAINITNPGGGYTSPPQVIFARNTNLVRTARNRQSLNSTVFNITGLTGDIAESDTTINVETTAAFPGSGNTERGFVNNTMSLPSDSTKTCGSTPVPLELATPQMNATILLSSVERPASITANSSTWNTRYKSLVSGRQSYTIAILLSLDSDKRLTRSLILNS